MQDNFDLNANTPPLITATAFDSARKTRPTQGTARLLAYSGYHSSIVVSPGALQ